MRSIWIPLSLCLACTGQVDESTSQGSSGSQAAAAVDPTQAEGDSPAIAALDPADLPKIECNEDLVAQAGMAPAPGEMQKMIKKDGIDQRLNPSKKSVAKVKGEKDQLAVLTGVLLADLVLTAEDKNTSVGERVQMLQKLKESSEELGLGDDIPRQIDQLIDDVNAGKYEGKKLTRHFDWLNAAMLGELDHEGAGWVTPLLQAGSWLEGAHLVSGAYQGRTKFDEAQKLFKQPQVVKYFQCYVQDRESDVKDGVINTLKLTLNELHQIAEKDSAITAADLKIIHDQTGNVLKFLN